MSAFWKDSIRGGLVRGLGPGEGSVRGFGQRRSVWEAASCSYHIIIWHQEGLCARKLCLSKNRMCLRLSFPEDSVQRL